MIQASEIQTQEQQARARAQVQAQAQARAQAQMQAHAARVQAQVEAQAKAHAQARAKAQAEAHAQAQAQAQAGTQAQTRGKAHVVSGAAACVQSDALVDSVKTDSRQDHEAENVQQESEGSVDESSDEAMEVCRGFRFYRHLVLSPFVGVDL